MSGMGWKLKCGIGTLSQGMHEICGPVVFQHLFLRLNQIQRRLKVRMLEDFYFDGILLVIAQYTPSVQRVTTLSFQL